MSRSLMRERGLQRVPILDEARRPLGIIYAREALQALLSESENEDELLRDYISGSGLGKTEWPSSGSVLSTDACPRQYNEYLKGAAMPRQNPNFSNEAIQRQQALSRWDNEGGAGPTVAPAPDKEQIPAPEMSNADLVALRVRVIALENLLISLLATASDQQLELARKMADYISPRPGFTHHPLTIHAAAHMIDLIERSSRFR